MKFMNDYDMQNGRQRFTRATKPNRLALVMVIEHLAQWADRNSDGWAYWPKPCQAAQHAIALVESRTTAENRAQEETDATDAEVAAAVKPIKAFLTRQKVSAQDLEIILRSVSDQPDKVDTYRAGLADPDGPYRRSDTIPLGEGMKRFTQGTVAALKVNKAHANVPAEAKRDMFWFYVGALAGGEYGVSEVEDFTAFVLGARNHAPGEVSDQPAVQWVVTVEREHGAPISVGPYSTLEQAMDAMQHSPTVEALTQEDCLECYVSELHSGDHRVGEI